MQTNQTPTTRRQFSQFLAAMAGAGATAAVPATALASPGSSITGLDKNPVIDDGAADDSELLKLEEEIFNAWHATDEHNDEIARLEKILRDKSFEFRVLVDENRRHIVCSMPEYEPYDRLVTLHIQHSTRMCDLIDRMWTIPAHTEAGRQAKADVLISCVLDWRDLDEQSSWQVKTTRRLLADLVGGESGRNMREQFA